MSRVARTCPSRLTATPPQTAYSTPFAFSTSMMRPNSSKRSTRRVYRPQRLMTNTQAESIVTFTRINASSS